MNQTPESFLDFLNATRPTDEKILVALNYYLSEVTGNKLPREMRDEVEARAKGQPGAVAPALEQLSRSRRVQVAGALAYFAQQWEDVEERSKIRRAFGAAGVKLPLIEAGVIAVVTMYAMFLVATKGRKIRRRTIKRGPDGSYEESEEEEMWGPGGPLQAVVSLFGAGKVAAGQAKGP
jgi:hypothetical protein